ncbi:MAG TPA: GNAT family N-acetyltransferase [Streptosporangiaceae bacterium]
MTAVEIRPYADADWPQVWPVIAEIVRAGDTFPYDPAMTEQQARDTWIEPPPGTTVVAVQDGRVIGTAKTGPNKQGPGAHIATASYMVPASSRGLGVGRALVTWTLDWARARGYAGMQFNAVAATNQTAVALYRRLGFELIGTIPGGFEHPVQGRVGLHIMYCPF